MKLVKRIIYSLLGLLMVLTVGMVGLILYAEYSGKPFSFKSTSALEQTAYAEDESRLVAEENGEPAPAQETDTAPTDAAPVDEEIPAPAAEANPASETAPIQADTAQASPADASPADASSTDATATYALNTESSIFHKMDCPLVADISSDNYTTMTGLKENVVARGYDPCGSCNP